MTSKKLYFEFYLPPRLTDEEIKHYFELYRLGDKEAYRILIERNLRLVVFIAKKYESTNIEIDDLYSIGNIGLIKAVSTFDLSKNFSFATYASRCIENEILMFLRKNKHILVNDISLDAPVLISVGEDNYCLYEVIPSDERVEEFAYERIETRNELIDAIRILDELERRVIFELFPSDGSKVTQKKAAEIIGISRSYVSRLKKRACRKLASYIDEQYNNIKKQEEKIKTKTYISK